MASQGKQTALLGAYLVVGEDLLKQRRVIDRLRGSVARAGDLSFNRDEFDGADATGEFRFPSRRFRRPGK